MEYIYAHIRYIFARLSLLKRVNSDLALVQDSMSADTQVGQSVSRNTELLT